MPRGSQSEERFGGWLQTGVSVHPRESGRLWGRRCPEGGERPGQPRVSYWGSLVSVSP